MSTTDVLCRSRLLQTWHQHHQILQLPSQPLLWTPAPTFCWSGTNRRRSSPSSSLSLLKNNQVSEICDFELDGTARTCWKLRKRIQCIVDYLKKIVCSFWSNFYCKNLSTYVISKLLWLVTNFNYTVVKFNLTKLHLK